MPDHPSYCSPENQILLFSLGTRHEDVGDYGLEISGIFSVIGINPFCKIKNILNIEFYDGFTGISAISIQSMQRALVIDPHSPAFHGSVKERGVS